MNVHSASVVSKLFDLFFPFAFSGIRETEYKYLISPLKVCAVSPPALQERKGNQIFGS